MSTPHERFADWLRQQVEERGWTYRELARRAGVSHVTISKIISEPAAPGWEVAQKLAHALNEPDVKILRLAGLLPSVSPEEEQEEELLTYFRQLPRVVRELMVDVIRDIHKHLSVDANLNRITEGLALDDTTIGDLRFLLSAWASLAPDRREELLGDMIIAAGRSRQQK